ncbi:cytochrome c oxidase assembly factor Coa1 family protein [Lysobacter capsici]|uniref:cytochrome c oxidase assembly factor Coa1 family protein n=1 Tax=Lysobacter capsici TaxID=435897 RepID=UPI001BFFF844|nr:cytochrome c oxidase assembly factor Coa1 family protein [Lysobacter capsici]QWF17293.1 cytochrome c oxidase assembly factor 1 family protein [Lysobacter capsici]
MNDRPNPGWWSRNWKWFVPTGCLTVILIAALLLFGLIGLGIKGVSSLMGSSEPVRHAIALAQANPAAVAALGTPLEPGMMINGTLQTDNSSGHADLSMPLKGPKGSGRVYIKGEREADRWTYSLIELAIDASGDRIDLLGGTGAATDPDKDTNDRLEVPPDIDPPPIEHSEPADAPQHEQPSETAPERGAHAG